MSGVVIIGAGECGVCAAFSLREGGFDGTITLLSAENTLPSSARIMHIKDQIINVIHR